MEIAIAVAVVTLIVGVLIFFAQGQNTGRARRADAIRLAVNAYIRGAGTIAGIPGALRAGVMTLPDAGAVATFLDECQASGDDCLPKTYRSELRDSELLEFFRRCSIAQDRVHLDPTVREILRSIQNARRT